MAKGKKTGGKNFKPGVVTNPDGRPPLSPELKQMRTLTYDQVSEIASIVINGKRDELQQILVNPNATVLQQIMAKAAINALATGNMGTINAFLDRIVGKARQSIELTGKEGGPVAFSDLSKDEILKETQAILEQLKKK